MVGLRVLRCGEDESGSLKLPDMPCQGWKVGTVYHCDSVAKTVFN